jgi:dethiobiotin synthetase
MKPVASGCLSDDGHVYLEDAERLRAAAGSNDDLSLICPVALPEPLSPHLAAERAQIEISRDAVFDAWRQLNAANDLVLVEGVGGLMVPITREWLVADLVQELDLPVVIVTRFGLGTINHTLLTVNECRRRGLSPVGLILSQIHPGAFGVAEETAAAELAALSRVPVLAQLPYQDAPDFPTLVERLAMRISQPACLHLLQAAGLEEGAGGDEERFGVDPLHLPEAGDAEGEWV